MFHSWNQAFRIIGFPGHSPNINPEWWWEQSEGWLIWPYYIFPINRHPGFIFITPSFHLSALFPAIRNIAIAGLPPMLDWWSSHQTAFVETGVFKMNTEFYCHICKCRSMIFRHNPLQCKVIPFTWFWFSDTIPLCWWCLSMISVCRHNFGNCCTGHT